MQQEESRYDRGLASMRAIFGPGIESALKYLAQPIRSWRDAWSNSRLATSILAPFWI